MEVHAGRQQQPQPHLAPSAAAVGVERRQHRRDHREPGEQVGHGEAGEHRQARPQGQHRHGRQVRPNPRRRRHDPPEGEDDPRRQQRLSRRQQPQRAQPVAGVDEQAVVDRTGAVLIVDRLLVLVAGIVQPIVDVPGIDRRRALGRPELERADHVLALGEVVVGVGEHRRPPDRHSHRHQHQAARPNRQRDAPEPRRRPAQPPARLARRGGGRSTALGRELGWRGCRAETSAGGDSRERQAISTAAGRCEPAAPAPI